MTDHSEAIRRTLKLIRQSENVWSTADGRWVVNTRTGEQTFDGKTLPLNYWEEREIWARDVDESVLPDQPELSRIYGGRAGKVIGFVGRSEGASEAMRRMWDRLCSGAPFLELPCSCVYYETRVGGHLAGGPCPLTGYEHEDCFRWLGII